MKRILFITWSVSFGYGTEKSMADVLNRLDSSKYDISILPIFKKSESRIFNDNIRILDALVDYTAENFSESEAMARYYEILASPLLFNKMINEKYDCIVACNHNAPSYFASYISSGAKILWIRGDMRELDFRVYDEKSEQYRLTKQEYDMQAKVLKCFDGIVVISDVVKNALSQLFGITKNVYKISNSVDTEKILKMSREKVTLPHKPIFTTLGRLDSNKNQILLLKAIKQVKKSSDNFVVYLLGDGEERGNLEQYITENDLCDNVKILGFVENPYPYIRCSTATVLTSLSEGFSLVLVESAVLGTPFISTDVGISRELFDKYGCGTIVNYDEKELASVILRYIFQYDGSVKNFAIGNRYDITVEVDRTSKLIDKVIDKSQTGQKLKRLPYPEISVKYCDLESHEILFDSPYILRVYKDEVPYEYLINRKSRYDKLIVFNNGAIAGGNVTFPVFQRHSWMDTLKTSCVFCMDPTLYLNSFLTLGWGIGKNGNYFLENSSIILGEIIEKMGIRLQDTVIYGTSAGGYLSIIMGTFLKGATVVADNSQLDVRNWIYKDALDSVITFSFDHIGEALSYPERFSVLETFKKHNYVPPIYLHVNLYSGADNSTQLLPFLADIEKSECMAETNNINVILHFSPEKGHDGLSMDEAVDFLYKILEIN